MDIVMDKRKICFFKSNHSNEYFVRIYKAKDAKISADRVNHRNGHEESGFKHFDCEVVLMVDVPDDIYNQIDKVADFIKSTFGKKTTEDSFLAECGWYEFADLSNTDKWIADFYLWKQKIRIGSAPLQTSLF